MRSRATALGIALLMAATAAIAVFLYLRGLDQSGQASTAGTIEVLVAKEDITAGTELDELISRGGFETLSIPEDTVVPGAITDLRDLQGQKAAAGILAGEQIPEARITGAVPGGRLGIPAGYTAVTVPLSSSRTVGEELTEGDRVTIYSTFGSGASSTTVTLVPEVQILKLSSSATAGGPSDEGGDVNVTFALRPADAQKVVLAQEAGTIYLAAIPPGETGKARPPISTQGVGR